MKRFAFLLLLISTPAIAGPLYVPATNGAAWPLTPGGIALTVKSNISMGIQGTLDWVESDASIRVAHDAHGANTDVLSLSGGPDIVLDEGFGPGFIGGYLQLGNHTYTGGRIKFAYDGTFISATEPIGHSKATLWENLSRGTAGATVYSYPGIDSQTATNEIGDYYGDGGLYSDGVLNFYAATPWYRGLPQTQTAAIPGRLSMRMVGTNVLLGMNGIKASFAAFTNQGASGEINHKWIATNGIPGEVANNGSIATTSDGSGQFWIRNNGAWLQLAPTINGFSTNLVAWREFNAGEVSPALGVSGAGLGYVANLFVITNRNLQANVFSIGDGGDTTIGGALSLGTTTAGYLTLQNTTTAAAGAQQVSPAVVWTGAGWKTAATAASQPVDFRTWVLPVQGSANPTAELRFQSQINNGGWVDSFALGSDRKLYPSGLTSYIYTRANGFLTIGHASGGDSAEFRTDGFYLVSGDGIAFLDGSIASGQPRVYLSGNTAGILSVDTTAPGNAAASVKATGYFEGYFASAASMTLTATNGVVNFTGATLTATLPTAVGITGRKFTIKSTNATGVTLATTSSQTIDGTTPVALTVGQSRTYQSDGANWWIVSGYL